MNGSAKCYNAPERVVETLPGIGPVQGSAFGVMLACTLWFVLACSPCGL